MKTYTSACLMFFLVFLLGISFYAQTLSVTDLANSLIGVPYQSNGNTPAGFDTAGLIQYVFKESMNIELPRYAHQQWLVGDSIKKENLKPGDVVFFQNNSGLIPGIYIGDKSFIFVTTSSGVAIQSLDSAYWTPLYYGAKRYNKNNIKKVYTTKNPIALKAIDLIGTPYLENGTTPEGFNSGGFIYYVFKEAKNIDLPLASSIQAEMGMEIPVDDIQEGDILVFEGSSLKVPAIYIGDGYFIIVTTTGVAERSLHDDNYWTPRFLYAKRLTNRDYYYLNPVNLTTHTNPIIRKAIEYIDVPYEFGGTDITEGIDCSYFVKLVFNEAKGIVLPRSTEQQWEVGVTITENEIRPGDVLYFVEMWQEGISHAAIYLGNNYFIHASSIGERVSISYLGGFWLKYFHGIKRFDNTKYNNIDLILLRRFMAGIPIENLDTFKYDLNGDGRITNTDLIILRRQLAGIY